MNEVIFGNVQGHYLMSKPPALFLSGLCVPYYLCGHLLKAGYFFFFKSMFSNSGGKVEHILHTSRGAVSLMQVHLFWSLCGSQLLV